MDEYEELSNNDLVKRCAENPRNRLAWNEFVRRFDKHIRLMVMRQCGLKHLSFQEIADDLANNVYLKLLDDNRKALRTFRGENENAIYKFLAVMAQHVVHNDWRGENAAKRRHTKVRLDSTLFDILANPYTPSPDHKLMLESLRQEVEMVLDEVITGNEKERDKQIFLYHVYDELTPKQISERVILSAQRIRNIITPIRKRLKARRASDQKLA